MLRLKEKLAQTAQNFWGFAMVYFALALPTYILPIYGSNSLFSYVMFGTNFFFWVHFAILFALIFWTRLRAKIVNKGYLIVFPQLALVFDLVPFLNFIPFAATCMHLLAVINATDKMES